MKLRKSYLALAITAAFVLPSVATVVVIGHSSDINWSRIAEVARQYPNFTPEQHAAIRQELRAEQRPRWSHLSTTARFQHASRVALRALTQLTNAATPPAVAPFLGNETIIRNASGNTIALQRQSDCSLSLFDGTYSYVNPTGSVQFTPAIAHYEQVLHGEAGLTSTPDVFSGGCTEPTAGIGARRAAFLGQTAGGSFLAGSGYNGSVNAVYFAVVNPATTSLQSGTQATHSSTAAPDTVSIAVGDLNGDGFADVVSLDEGAGAIHVWLANANGTLASPVTYALTGDTTEGATIADINGDGKADVIVATHDTSTTPGQEHLCILTGVGNGTLNSAQCTNVTTPRAGDYLGNLIAADIRGAHSLDLIGANGLVLLNNGSGSFSAGAQVFTSVTSTSNFGPNLTTADFNHDGKLDLAMDDGQAVHIYLGNGDGTFIAGNSYASNTEVGYLAATDLDGDGNVDLYVGLANGGVFAGDQFDASQSYALMGNGDGTFQGAPYVPFVYTGTNLADLNGDGKLDAVGVGTGFNGSPALTFTSYLANGKGSFSTGSALSVASVSFSNAQNNPYLLPGIDSFGLADINGDGKPDLVFLASGLTVRPLTGFDTPGILISLGDGAGHFAAPTFLPSGHFVPGNDIDINPGLTNLRVIDVNGDGKPDLVFNYNDGDYSVTPNLFSSGVAVQLGNGDGTFGAAQTLVLYSGDGSNFLTVNVVGIADLNGDHKPDLLIMAQTARAQAQSPAQYTLEVALGNGDGTFRAPTPVNTNDIVQGEVLYGTQYVPLAIADMNNDGIPDIVTLGQASNGSLQVAIALGNGDGTFKAPNKVNYSVIYEQESLAVGDFNGDGKQDVAITGYLGNIDSGITFGNGDGTLSLDANGNGQFNELFFLSQGGASTAADFNGDGKADVLSGRILMLNAASAAGSTFALSASSTSGTVSAGQSVQTKLTLTPAGGFNQSVSLSCSGLPSGAACQFSSPTVAVNSSVATSTLTIATTARTAQAHPWLPGGILLAGIALPCARLGRRRTALRGRCSMLLVVLLGVVTLNGCGGGSSSSSSASASSGGTAGSSSSSSSSGTSGSSGGSSSSSSSGGSSASGTPAGRYPVTITAVGGSVTQTLQYELTVN
jgi:hypothetical protein